MMKLNSKTHGPSHDREAILTYAKDHYGIEPETPWANFPHYQVLRHAKNKKWFALIMDVSSDKLNLQPTETVDILNIKCDSDLIGVLLGEKGFLPAYHMNKTHWISIILDDSVDLKRILSLLNLSFELTQSR
jgi:predicted DNA-binding protein (MmcQ/YjbR family)